MKDDDGKPIYFDSIDNSAYVTGKSKHSAWTRWIYMSRNLPWHVCADIGDDPTNPDVKIAWKYLYTAKDTWLGPNRTSVPSVQPTISPWNRTEKYDMTFNGAVNT